MAALRGRLRPAARQHSWPVADVSGDTTAYALQHLLRRALWEPEAVRDALRTAIRQPLQDPEAVLVLDETGVLTQGRHAASVARQDSGTAGRIEPGQIGVCVASASRLGHTLVDRALAVPEAWTADRERGRRAGMPEDRRFATTPPAGQRPAAPGAGGGRAREGGIDASVDGDDRRLRVWVEAPPQAYGLAVPGTEEVWLGSQQRWGKPSVAPLAGEGWTRRSAGDGATGPRW